jgi:hypothetical protein
VFALYAWTDISYLWFNVIGCGSCMLFAVLIQAFLPRMAQMDADKGTG